MDMNTAASLAKKVQPQSAEDNQYPTLYRFFEVSKRVRLQISQPSSGPTVSRWANTWANLEDEVVYYAQIGWTLYTARESGLVYTSIHDVGHRTLINNLYDCPTVFENEDGEIFVLE